jgi:protein-tyrosine phosphatase
MVMKSENDFYNEYIDKINDKIYLGCYKGVEEIDYLEKNGIKNILTCCKNFENSENKKFGEKFINKIIPIDDISEENILSHLKDAINFIHNCDKVYVHCIAGVSRSPSIVIAYIMYVNKISYNEAYWIVKNKRKFISPNEGFVKQLKEFEKEMKNLEWELEKFLN